MADGNKILLAGPWVGELGYELFCWQAYVRKLSRQFEKTIVIGRPGHKYLYEDFCQEYIEFDPRSFKTRRHRCFEFDPEIDIGKEQTEISLCGADEIIKNTYHTFHLAGNFDVGYIEGGKEKHKDAFLYEQEFYKYDFKDGKSFDVIFHCRNKSTGSNRNWDINNWEMLYQSLPKTLNIACIGNKEATYINGTTDLRGIEIKKLVGVLNNSKLIVGPSSGPMHLASLCGMTHLVWSVEYNRKRYEKDWNPFKTKTIFYSEGGWNPDPSKLANFIIKLL